METIDRIPLKSLPSRYNIARSLLYTRLKDLNIKPEKDSKQAYVNGVQLALLDALNDHIGEGKITSAFLKSNSLEKCSSAIGLGQAETTIDQVFQNNVALPDALITSIFQLTLSLQRFEYLERAATIGWLLPSSLVSQLIGVNPHGSIFERGSFTFIRSGKIGREAAWEISKNC